MIEKDMRFTRGTLRVCLLGTCLLASSLKSQLPSESLLILNASSEEAMKVSMGYAELRGFPRERMLFLTPDKDLFREAATGKTRWSIGEQQAREIILNPVLKKLKELEDPSPTALIFSPDWPTRVRLPGKPSVSLTAFVGFRGRMPEAQAIKSGQAVSLWYSHPPEIRSGKGRLLTYPAPDMKEKGVHPSAMLGVFYEPLSPQTLTAALKRAVEADHQRPEGHMVLITNQDVRTRARQDQFEPAKADLEERGLPVLLGDRKTPLPKSILGVMTGSAKVNTSRFNKRLAPGAFAEHLTSFAAKFDTQQQTKMTEWIDAGAAGTVGTVTEPYAIWTKFPRVAVLTRYHKGATLLEAVYQSIASPYQSLILGDPLCRPWGKTLPLSLEGEWQPDGLRITAKAGFDTNRTDLHLFVDGKRVKGNGPEWLLPLNPSGRKGPVELILHARYNWSPPETGWIRKEIPLP